VCCRTSANPRFNLSLQDSDAKRRRLERQASGLTLTHTVTVDFSTESWASVKTDVPFLRDRKRLSYGIDLNLDLQLLTSPDVVHQSAARDVRPVSFPALYTAVRLAIASVPPNRRRPPSDRWTTLTNWDYTRFVNGSWIFQRRRRAGGGPGKSAGSGRQAGPLVALTGHRSRRVSLGDDSRTGDAVDRERRLAARQPRTMRRTHCATFQRLVARLRRTLRSTARCLQYNVLSGALDPGSFNLRHGADNLTNCRAMLRISRRAVSVRPSVCLYVPFMYSFKNE